MESDNLGSDANSTEETSLMQLFPPDSVDINDLFGVRKVSPRIGDLFQVEIPPMITGSEYIQLLMNPTDSDYISHVSYSFLMGLSIPIMWLRDEPSNADESAKCTKRKKSRSNTGKKSSELNASELNDSKESEPKNCKAKIAGRTSLDRLSKCTDCSLVPGLLGDPWKDAEKDIFLLGLYIFGKNFFQIKKFIETKEMGDILSFYYGEFYRSAEYRRWTDCRKPRSRKCVYGRKIFSKWRQKELVSRLLPHVPEESQNSLLEVSKSFVEGRTSLESYVSSLKATVGIRVLVESVGIGKGKEDLTSLTMEPVKTNQVFPVCPTILSGKACSSLTSTDIIQFLTGDFRLSKARCNDIFWEAVWPRLLARGWHSEEPRNQGYLTPKDYLVFLKPGIEKFSRRKLVKGDHYFDSVSDILKKVASEPKLIELEIEEARVSSCSEEDQWLLEELSDQENPSNHQPHCYLKPLTSDCNLKRMKFMVVDSSLVQGGKSSEVRELRYLPVDFTDAYKLSCLLRKNESFEIDAFNKPLKEEKNISTAKHSKDMLYNGGPKSTKFMVVDSSLIDGGKSSKMRTLRYCSVESKISSDMGSLSRPLKEEKNICTSKHSKDMFYYGGPKSTQFMVVDTSLVEGGKSSKMRTLRCCSIESKIAADMSFLSREDEGNSFDDSLDENESNMVDTALSSEQDAFDGAISNEKPLNSDCGQNVEIRQDQRANNSEDKKSSNRMIKLRFSRRAKPDNTDSLAPLVKQRRLTACAKTESCFSTLDLPDAGYSGVCQVGPSQDKTSPLSCSAGGSPEEEISHSKGIISGSCFGMEISHGKNERHRTQSLIDLNVSQIPSDSENLEVLTMEVEGSQGMNSNGSLIHESKLNLEAPNSSIDVSTAAQQPNMNTRRQSTRNRALTAKALEALACGFWNVNKKQKTGDFHTREIPFSNPSCKARRKVKPSSEHGTAGTIIMDLKVQKELNETSTVSKYIVGQTLN